MSTGFNAIDFALILGQKGCTALERRVIPTEKDVEEARDAFKAAAKKLTSAYDLMIDGIFEVARDPNTASPLPFDREADGDR